MVAATRRRSPRLAALESTFEDNEKSKPAKATKKSTKAPKAEPTRKKKARRKSKQSTDNPEFKPSGDNDSTPTEAVSMLPRTRETKIKQDATTAKMFVMGIDEAGRGPLAGPVVAAAAVVPTDIPGITDSKKITSETTREELYEAIVTSPDVSWAVAIVDAPRIDEINILQATMQAMSMAASALVCDNAQTETEWKLATQMPACTSRNGCYVACGGKLLKPPPLPSKANNDTVAEEELGKEEKPTSPYYYALVDGNRIPKDLPCNGESIVKGDSKEYSIAAASLLAKVTRDRLMRSYDALYPEYKLAKHKGYPTKEHMAAVFDFGASPIHRRTFAPLKHMTFDENGKIIKDQE